MVRESRQVGRSHAYPEDDMKCLYLVSVVCRARSKLELVLCHSVVWCSTFYSASTREVRYFLRQESHLYSMINQSRNPGIHPYHNRDAFAAMNCAENSRMPGVGTSRGRGESKSLSL